MKCRICKQEIKKDEQGIIVGKQTYYHIQCYENKYKDKIDYDDLQELLQQGNDRYNKHIEKKKQDTLSGLNKSVYWNRDKLVQFIYQVYGISSLPKHFFIRLNNIEKGKDDKIGRAISSLEILDMLRGWQIRLNNTTKDKHFENNIQKFYYHFSIILNKYDEYLKIKENAKNKNLENKQTKEKTKEFLNYQKIIKTLTQNKQKEEVFDMSEIV